MIIEVKKTKASTLFVIFVVEGLFLTAGWYEGYSYFSDFFKLFVGILIMFWSFLTIISLAERIKDLEKKVKKKVKK